MSKLNFQLEFIILSSANVYFKSQDEMQKLQKKNRTENPGERAVVTHQDSSTNAPWAALQHRHKTKIIANTSSLSELRR